jgi:hypothetical protein
MASSPAFKRLLAGCLVWLGSIASALAQGPDAKTFLGDGFAPKQKNVDITTPAAAEIATCTVDVSKGDVPGTTVYTVLDAKKQTLRRFVAVGAKVEQSSYFKDGSEVYREIDTNRDGVADQFRWLNAGGMKWGVDLNGDGKIDSWRLISAEEVCQEAFAALSASNYDRLKALFITEAEVQSLKLSKTQADRIAKLQAGSLLKFQTTLKKLDAATPSCVPGEVFGAANDIIKFSSRSILYKSASKKDDWVHTGELIQVGLAWRLIDVPGEESPDTPGGDPIKISQKLRDALDLLAVHDKVTPAATAPMAKNVEVDTYLTKRIKIIQQIVEAADDKDRENWYKQMIDNMSTAAQNMGDEATLGRLTAFKDQISKGMPGSNLAAYAVYRDLWTRYSLASVDPKAQGDAIRKVQEGWLAQLATFVKDYPKSEDTPDALSQLALGCEFSGKEEESKRWYKAIVDNFPTNRLAPIAKGSIDRLDLVGNDLKLAGPQLNNAATPFDITSLKGKAVIVYYWASHSTQCVGDFARLKQVVNASAGKVELVCVSLDETAEKAQEFLKANPVPGVQLFQASAGGAGLSSPFAVQYGIQGLPTAFLVRPDGKVANRSLQITDLENELKRIQ